MNAPYTALIPNMTSFKMTTANRQNRTERISNRPIVITKLLARLPSGSSRITFKGRMLAAWTIGINPKIKAVTSPIRTPPPMVNGSSRNGMLMLNACCTRLRTRKLKPVAAVAPMIPPTRPNRPASKPKSRYRSNRR